MLLHWSASAQVSDIDSSQVDTFVSLDFSTGTKPYYNHWTRVLDEYMQAGHTLKKFPRFPQGAMAQTLKNKQGSKTQTHDNASKALTACLLHAAANWMYAWRKRSSWVLPGHTASLWDSSNRALDSSISMLCRGREIHIHISPPQNDKVAKQLVI